jgi:hypothetical protein
VSSPATSTTIGSWYKPGVMTRTDATRSPDLLQRLKDWARSNDVSLDELKPVQLARASVELEVSIDAVVQAIVQRSTTGMDPQRAGDDRPLAPSLPAPALVAQREVFQTASPVAVLNADGRLVLTDEGRRQLMDALLAAPSRTNRERTNWLHLGLGPNAAAALSRSEMSRADVAGLIDQCERLGRLASGEPSFVALARGALQASPPDSEAASKLSELLDAFGNVDPAVAKLLSITRGEGNETVPVAVRNADGRLSLTHDGRQQLIEALLGAPSGSFAQRTSWLQSGLPGNLAHALNRSEDPRADVIGLIRQTEQVGRLVGGEPSFVALARGAREASPPDSEAYSKLSELLEAFGKADRP